MQILKRARDAVLSASYLSHLISKNGKIVPMQYFTLIAPAAESTAVAQPTWQTSPVFTTGRFRRKEIS